MVETADDFLAHFGVKGMKWGQRKNREHISAVRAARKEAYQKSFDAYKAHKARNTAAAGAGAAVIYKANPTGQIYKNKAAGVAAVAGMNIATIPMIRAQGYGKGKSVALGLIGGPISLVVVSEISARKNAKA